MTDTVSMNNKLMHNMREKEGKRMQERKRNLVYLVTDFLRSQGYLNTASTLVTEARLSTDIEVCDNIDLDTILLEYFDYYFTKFNKYPKICRKSEPVSTIEFVKQDCHKKEKLNKISKKGDDENSNLSRVKITIGDEISNSLPNFEIKVNPFIAQNIESRNCQLNQKKITDWAKNFVGEKMLKPLGNLYPRGSDWMEIAETMSKEIVLTNLNVHWDDIKGYVKEKNLLKEATVYPIKYPFLFSGKISPWKGILLYGPPGTGKTMLARAVATECDATFFNVTSSSIISKWRGESEKYIRVLLDLAKHYAPSIIFIDEIDWTAMGDGDSRVPKSEPSRRFRAELLARLDGLLTTENTNILLLAATNIPWDLDTALLRRLEKHIYIGLPDRQTQLQILKTYVSPKIIETSEFQDFLKLLEGFSCADLKLLCKEAWMTQLRPIWEYLERNDVSMNKTEYNNSIDKLCYLKEARTSIKPITLSMEVKYKKWINAFYCDDDDDDDDDDDEDK